jgi:threonine/homoserine/homoserine lactone efflux protein
MIHAVTAFAALSLIMTITPGPDSLLVLRSSLRDGRSAGARVAAGATCGSLAWGAASAVGVTAVLAASAQIYRGVQLAGAAYLVYLGIHSWHTRSARQDAPGRRERVTGFRAGLLSNVLNPKVGLFFLAVMPQFIPHRAPAAGYTLTFAVVDMLIAGTWLAIVVWVSDRARTALRREAVRQTLDRIAGAALIGLGLRVAAEQVTI